MTHEIERGESTLMLRVRELAAWRRLNPHRWPQPSSDDSVERSLAFFVANQRSGRRVSADRAAVLDARCTGWRANATRPTIRSSPENVEALVVWRSTHDVEWPRATSTGPEANRLGL